MTTQDRFRGCLAGLAAGDAVGTTVEFMPRGGFEPLRDMVGGGPFNLRPGQWTDDTSMALCLAESLKKKLELILEGDNPYDIFVRWKPLEKQPIAWNPDLNDGVRLNIRPFMTVSDVSKKGAGILRDKPNIHWKKDRGKDVQSVPWYHLFKGERINDHHLSLQEKQAARNQGS